MAQPHILILMPDQQRGDCIGAAGHSAIRTPNMDRLATEGTRFCNATTVSPLCMPARASFISGLYPHNHGMWVNDGQLPAEDETFFQILQTCGYRTAHIGKSHYYPHTGQHLKAHEPYMHARGFDDVHETTGPWATVTTDSYLTDHWRTQRLVDTFRQDYLRRRDTGPFSVWPSPLPADEFPDGYVGRKAVEYVQNYNDDRPMCLFVGFGGPHEPWDAPHPYSEMYDPTQMPSPVEPEPPGGWLSPLARELWWDERRLDHMTPEDVGRIRANYYGKISLVDEWFGRIFDALAERGMWDNTLVVFWSDHGDMTGDHQRLHKQYFERGSVEVPFIFRWPEHIPAGVATDALAGTLDVFPTVLEAAGAPASQRCFGQSLWPIFRDPGARVHDAVFSEVHVGQRHRIMVRTDRYRCVLATPSTTYTLYDLEEDPNERRNLAGHPDFTRIAAEMREHILALLLSAQITQSMANA